ncbi:alpha/beta fold hydrolase [Usitatibacter rugosus]|nr:alpha/beta fold hydrolase [Usitatibacter rugosus]
MLSTLVRAQLAAELLIAIALGAWLHRCGWNLAAVGAFLVAVSLGVRLLIVVTSSLVAHANRSPREPGQQVGFTGGVRVVLDEWRAMLVDNFAWLPFESVLVRADPPSGGPHVPVLTVHGYLSNRGLMRPVVDAMDRAGAEVHTFNFRGLFGSIEPLVDQLEAEVQRLLAASGHPQVVLVCHSMGGLVTRAWLARHGAQRVARLVTIASPHHGTAIAKLGLGANARQMRQGSDFLRVLEAAEGGRGPACPTTSIYSVHDNLVAPQETSRLPQATNIALHGWGHVGIVAAPPLHAAVVAALREAGALPKP